MVLTKSQAGRVMYLLDQPELEDSRMGVLFILFEDCLST